MLVNAWTQGADCRVRTSQSAILRLRGTPAHERRAAARVIPGSTQVFSYDTSLDACCCHDAPGLERIVRNFWRNAIESTSGQQQGHRHRDIRCGTTSLWEGRARTGMCGTRPACIFHGRHSPQGHQQPGADGGAGYLHPCAAALQNKDSRPLLSVHLSVRILLNNRLLSTPFTTTRLVCRRCQPACRISRPLTV